MLGDEVAVDDSRRVADEKVAPLDTESVQQLGRDLRMQITRDGKDPGYPNASCDPDASVFVLLCDAHRHHPKRRGIRRTHHRLV